MRRSSFCLHRLTAKRFLLFTSVALAAVVVAAPVEAAVSAAHPVSGPSPLQAHPGVASSWTGTGPGASLSGRSAGTPTSSPTTSAQGGAATATMASPAYWPLDDLRIVSYYPAQWSWENMWLFWHPEVIDPDLARVAALHANTVRVIIPPKAFGYPGVSPVMAAELTNVIDMAARHGLRVQLTLFDVGFAQWQDFVGSEQWARAVIGPYVADPRIAFIEIRNEIDPAQAGQMAWARHMLPYVRSISRGIPVTVSVCGCDNPADLLSLKQQLGSAQPDLYDFHFYADPGRAFAVFAAAKAIVAPRPLLIGETGYQTFAQNGAVIGVPWTTAAQEAYQDHFFRTVGFAARSLGLPPPAPWALTDFTCSSCGMFGLYHVDGTAKPAAASVAAMFSGAALDANFNQGFERAAGPLPAGWRIWGWQYGNFARDTTVAHSGSASASINGSSLVPGGSPPAFFISPVTSPMAGRAYTLTAFVRGSQATGTTTIAITWYDGLFHVLGSARSNPLPSGNTDWTQLSVSSQAPRGASCATLSLASAQNGGTVWFDDISFN